MRFLVDECTGPAVAACLGVTITMCSLCSMKPEAWMITRLFKRHFRKTGFLSPMTRTSEIKSIEMADSIEVLSCFDLKMSGLPQRSKYFHAFLKHTLTSSRTLFSWLPKSKSGLPEDE